MIEYTDEIQNFPERVVKFVVDVNKKVVNKNLTLRRDGLVQLNAAVVQKCSGLRV